VFNTGDTDENYRKQDLVELLQARLDGVDVRFVDVEEDPRDYRVSFAKIEQAIGFRAARTVPDGIDEVIDAVRNGAVGDIGDVRYRN
jgi:nucleoside-diphosphate-sugar epimerase